MRLGFVSAEVWRSIKRECASERKCFGAGVLSPHSAQTFLLRCLGGHLVGPKGLEGGVKVTASAGEVEEVTTSSCAGKGLCEVLSYRRIWKMVRASCMKASRRRDAFWRVK